MKMNTITLLLICAVLAIIAGALLQVSKIGRAEVATIATYQECAAAGYPILETYPTQCKTPDGRTFANPDEQAGSPPGGLTTLPDPRDSASGGSNAPSPVLSGRCVRAGCSQQLCVEEGEAVNIVTTCEYRAEYACYKTAACERQGNGKCGWTQTAALKACVANPPALDSSQQVY